MNCENRKIVIVFSSMICLVVLAIIFFDLNLYVKAFLGTVVLGLLCFMRALTSAVEILENEVENEEQVDEKLSEKGTDRAHSDNAEEVENKDEDSTCVFSASSEDFLRHLKDSFSSKK